VNGSFKIPALRNVALNAPYFHDGGAATLDQVLDFYNRGGNFANPEQDKAMAGTVGLFNAAGNRANMLAFLQSLTDPRVDLEQAPFDHPELLIPNGDATAPTMTRLPAVGAAGLTAAKEAPLPTVALTTTTLAGAGAPITGTKEAGATVQVTVNGVPVPANQVTTTDTTWSTSVAGLASGANTISVTANDLAGGVTTVTGTVTLALPSGIIVAGETAISVADALKALRIAIGLVTPTAAELASGDVAPLVNGLPAPDGKIDVADALVILRKVVGLEHF
jgi:hypothetical protein